MNCPNCSSININQRADIVQYDIMELRSIAVIVPVMTCKDCGDKWTDDRAEDAKWKASH
jgi:YgiT-type zinc finger domain-containing protein|tara:strand:+ start:204 stop:380 length:177 start_codon:yes stop_codon:yes gene_type:complete